MEIIEKKTPRIEVVDALRGIAVMAIILLHCVEHFIYPVYPTNSPTWLNILDQGVLNATFGLFGGKAYAIFALLFGFTFYLQYNNQQKKGNDFGFRYLWRLLLLIVFASFNAAFFPGGDVLLLFVVVAPVLVIARKWSDKAVLALSIFFLLQPVEWIQYISHVVNPAFQLPDWGAEGMYKELVITTQSGNLGEFLWKNITLGQKASLAWAFSAGRPEQTAGIFLLGLYLSRKQLFFSNEKNHRFWQTILIVGAVSFAPLYQLKELIMESDPFVRQTAGTAFDMWQKLAFTLVLVASFVLLYQRERFSRSVSNLRFYGRMSLTNYVSQSLIGAIIFFPFGMHLAPYTGYTLSLIIGMLVFWMQVRLSKWWLGKHKQGPLEAMWHKWTWLGKSQK